MGSKKIFSRTSRKSSGKSAENEEQRDEPVASPTTDGVDGQFERGSVNATAPVTEPVEFTTESNPGPTHEQVVSEAADAEPQTSNPTSPKSESKIKSWFRGRLSRRFSKPPPPEESTRQEGETTALNTRSHSSRSSSHIAPRQRDRSSLRPCAPTPRTGGRCLYRRSLPSMEQFNRKLNQPTMVI